MFYYATLLQRTEVKFGADFTQWETQKFASSWFAKCMMKTLVMWSGMSMVVVVVMWSGMSMVMVVVMWSGMSMVVVVVMWLLHLPGEAWWGSGLLPATPHRLQQLNSLVRSDQEDSGASVVTM